MDDAPRQKVTSPQQSGLRSARSAEAKAASAQAKAASASPGAPRSYGRGATILSAGIATTGLVTFAYFSLASHALNEVDYKGISLLWSVMFLIISIIYRPVEQLLSRTISARRARGLEGGHPLRTPVTIQAAFASLFLVIALTFRTEIEQDVFDGSSALYWVLVVGVVAYAASYFARGWLAGHSRFGLYGGLVLLESCSRCLFALAVILGIASGQDVVAMGIAAAPLVSLMVVPWALRGRDPAPATEGGPSAELGSSTRFAAAVLAIMAAEQALLNVPVVSADVTSTDAALAGFVFNVLLITRAPLQLFQAIQTSLLPHLSGLAATGGGDEFSRSLRVTVLAIAGFAGLVVIGLAAVGPWAMGVLFGGDYDYGRWGLVLVGIGMGFHLTAGTLNQAALARDRAGRAAASWLICAGVFLVWLFSSPLGDPVLEVELGYCVTAAVLAGALWWVERSAHGRPINPAASAAASPDPGRSAPHA
jgi:O-antigen/teichoic acid export membrane protein